MDKQRKIIDSYNITGSNFSNIGNVTNITVSHPMGSSSQPLTLESRVAFGALLNSAERYPAPHCHPGTRIAAKRVVKDWIGRRGFGSEKRIMWISGGPGVGKSAILQTVCETLAGDDESDSGDDALDLGDDDDVGDGLIDACYFFGRGMGDREKAIFFPATIAYQLVLYRPSCGGEIRTILTKNPSILLESFISQFRKLVLRPAKALAESEAPVTIVIDALDECNNVRDQVALLDTIVDATAKANMRFVIASRPEEHIQAFFQRTNVSEHTYHIQLDGDFRANRDIGIFLRDEFSRIRERRPGLCPRLPNGEEWPGSVVIYRLIYDSDGQFIYPTLVIAFIDTSYPPPDQQLKSLLAAPPVRAFSKLDALYHYILSRSPPKLPAGSDELLDFQKLVMRILRVVVCWPNTLSAAGIAEVLDKRVDVVLAIIHGPMRSLFKFESSDLNSIITLCHKSLRDYLLDFQRSQEFFLETADSPDTLYREILSRQPPSNPLQAYPREVLMGVLTVLVAWPAALNMPQIGTVLGVAPSLVEVVVSGPAKSLFIHYADNLYFSTSSLKDFLEDANRAGTYFISDDKLDALFTQILSCQPPSDPPQFYSREVLMGVLLVVVAPWNSVTVPQIASSLDVAPSLVEAVVFGPAKALFMLDRFQVIDFSIPSLKDFLMDAKRAGEFFISRDTIDTYLTQILSQPSSPSQSYSRDLLMGVLTVLVVWGGWLNVGQIAALLDVDPDAVTHIVFGMQLFRFYPAVSGNTVSLIPEVVSFLQDADRAGKYYIPPKDLNPRYDSMYAKVHKIFSII